MKKYVLLCIMLLPLFTSYVKGQSSDYVVKGAVSAYDGEKLIGVSVVIKGTTQGTVTNVEGEYSLRIDDPENTVLVFSYVGYITEEIAVNNQSNIKVSLMPDITSMDEIVVIGYGTQKRSEITTSVSSVKEDDFLKGAVQNPLQLIRGRVPGLAINTTSGSPGDNGIQMLLRGVSTFSGNQSPLIVIDGVIGGSLNLINFDDVEQIDVLKDGSAAAIYGTRGTNGVILITTKKAKTEGKPAIDYHGYLSSERVSNQIDVFSPEAYRQLPTTTDGFFSINDLGASTNWGDEVMGNAFSQVHSLSIRGNSGATSYLASANYRDQEGIIENTNSKRMNYRLGITQKIFDDIVEANLNVSATKVNENPNTHGSGVYFATRVLNPTSPIMDANGNYTLFPEAINPIQEISEVKRDLEWSQNRIDGTVTIRPVDNLNIRVLGAIQDQYVLGGSYANRNYVNGSTYNGQVWRNTDKNKQTTFESTINYDLELDARNSFTFLGGYNYQEFEGEGYDIYNYNFPTDIFDYNRIDLGLALPEGKADMGSYKWNSRLIAFFGRVNYSFENKYFVSASIRREGSTKFGDNNKWGSFPSASVGWRISDESFMESFGFINDLKLRAGYGITGTEPQDPYLSQLKYNYTSILLGPEGSYYAVEPSINANPNLKWETKKELNIGVDFTLLKGRIKGNVDYYNRTTSDLISTFNVPVPPNLAPTIIDNVGEVSNTGIEVLVSGDVVKSENFFLNVTANFSRNKNVVNRLSNENYQRDFLDVGWTGAPVQKTTHRVKEGEPLGNFYGWKSTGLTDDGKFIIESPEGGEGEYGNEDDRQVIGNGLPKILGGFVLSGGYKGFDFSVSLRGAFDFQILNQYRMLWENFTKGQQWNFPETVLDKPYNSTSYLNDAPSYVSYYLEDGDYVKLDNISLGYTFNTSDTKYIRNLRVYLAGANLHTFTKYKGVDPEIPLYGLSPGMDPISRYPTTSTYTLGIQLGL